MLEKLMGKSTIGNQTTKILRSLILRLGGGKAGLGIVLFTLIVRFLLLPLNLATLRSSRKMQELQLGIKAIQDNYKVEPPQKPSPEKAQRLQAEIMSLYREQKINPAAGCWPIIVQVSVLSFLKWTIRSAREDSRFANGGFLWCKDLTKPDPYFILPILATVLNFVTTSMAMTNSQVIDAKYHPIINNIQQASVLGQGLISVRLPASEALYSLISELFSIVQQYFVTGWGTLPDVPGLGFLRQKKQGQNS